MKTKISVFTIILGLMTLIYFPVWVSCNNNIIVSQSFSLEEWGELKTNDTIKFEFSQKEDLEVNINIFFRINQQSYNSYENLYFFTYLIKPESNDTISVDTLEYKLYNNFGECLGSGPSNLKTFEKIYKKNYTITKGDYSLNIVQGMYNDLTGLESIGFTMTK